MTDSKSQRERASHVILWIARGWSILSLVFVGSILAGEVLHPTAAVPTTPRDLIGLALFPFGTCLGMLAVYSWEALGGAMNVGSLVAFSCCRRRSPGVSPRLFLSLSAWTRCTCWLSNF